MHGQTCGCHCSASAAFKSKKGYNFVKKYMRITSPTGMGSPFDSEQQSEFRVNIFSNNRDIRKCQSFRTTTLLTPGL